MVEVAADDGERDAEGAEAAQRVKPDLWLRLLGAEFFRRLDSGGQRLSGGLRERLQVQRKLLFRLAVAALQDEQQTFIEMTIRQAQRRVDHDRQILDRALQVAALEAQVAALLV